MTSEHLESDRATITVLVADDDAEFRAAIVAVVEQEPTLTLAGVAADAEHALALVRELSPEVALVDVRMGAGGGVRVARELRAAGSPTRVLALSAYSDHGTVAEMIEAGAVGYLIKGAPLVTVIDAIHAVASGGRPLAPQLAEAVRAGGDGTGEERGPPITVMVADDNRHLLETVADLISADPGLELVGLARDAAEALRLAILHRPQVALVDWRMPGGGVAAVAAIREQVPVTRCIGLSFATERDAVLDMLRAGATSYVVKPARADDLTAAIRKTATGSAVLSHEVTSPVIKELVVELRRRKDDTDRIERERARVRAAIDGGLRIVYQPIFELESRQPVAVEALARFELEPRRGPEVWFQEAIAVGLGVDLEAAAVRRALGALEWLPNSMDLHINLSPSALFSGLGTTLTRTSDPARIVLEITEHAQVLDYDQLAAVLAPLRESGIRVAVDDVGSGFASLRHVVRLGPDVLKLDVSLCRGIDANPLSHAVAVALVSSSLGAGWKVIAEGVETPGELATLVEMGATHAQGYLLGRPAPRPVELAAAV